MKASWNFPDGAPIAEGRTVLESLGGGRRYEVFLAEDKTLDVLAVAKVLRPDRVEDERALRALRREAALLERLDHPVLVHGLDTVLDGAFPHLLVEYVEGANLRELLAREATLTTQDALAVARDLLSCVDYLARSDVVHLDIKPSNVLLADTATLIDLGAARTFEELRARTRPIGTAAYMAPEQCAPGSVAHIGPPADVWGVGATVYHALTGDTPFSKPAPRGSETAARYPQLVEAPRPLHDYVPEHVSRAVLSLLARDPARRPTAREALAAFRPLADMYASL
jgi:serine/threonine protein kinase